MAPHRDGPVRPVLLGALAALGLAVVIVVFPVLLVRPAGKITPAERLTAENDVRATLVQVVGGALLLSGVCLFTARTLRLYARALEVSAQTLEVTREGQITDRFTRAIDQLGNPTIVDVRLGGIYALERIAIGSEQDYGPIMEILTAFIREHAQWKRSDPRPEPESDAVRPRLRADLQAAARVLGRRPEQRRQEEDQPLNLSEVDLRGGDFSGGHLEGAFLYEAHLQLSLIHI